MYKSAEEKQEQQQQPHNMSEKSSMTYHVQSRSDDAIEQLPRPTSLPPYTEIPPNTDMQSYPEMSSAPSSSVLQKPIVIPQTTNMFFIKSISPFSRSYAPALSQLPSPLSQEDLLTFIDGLNRAFMATPLAQAALVTSGILMSTQILPAQLAGGGLQVGAALASAGVSIVRVRKYMKEANARIFTPRGLKAKVMSTKKMMAAIEAPQGNRLKLPPLHDFEDLQDRFASTPTLPQDGGAVGDGGQSKPLPEDLRMRWIRALEDYISPLTFDVPPDAVPSGWFERAGTAPLRWANKRQVKKMGELREKGLERSKTKTGGLEDQVMESNKYIMQTEVQIGMVQNSGVEVRGSRAHDDLQELESAKSAEVDRRDKAIAEIRNTAPDKKLAKADKKEEKVANRVLWLVICRADGSSSGEDDPLEVESVSSEPQ